MVKVSCKNSCGFTDEFEYCEFGLNYYQAEGLCPQCEAPTIYEDGSPTLEVMGFQLTDDYREYLELSTMEFRDSTQENRFNTLKEKYPL